MDDAVQTPRGGLPGVDVVGYISILAGAASLLLAGAAWVSPILEDSLRPAAVVRSVAFSALAFAYGLSILQRRKVALHRGWCLLPILGAGLSLLGLTGVGLVFWFTHHLRKQASGFAA